MLLPLLWESYYLSLYVSSDGKKHIHFPYFVVYKRLPAKLETSLARVARFARNKQFCVRFFGAMSLMPDGTHYRDEVDLWKREAAVAREEAAEARGLYERQVEHVAGVLQQTAEVLFIVYSDTVNVMVCGVCSCFNI